MSKNFSRRTFLKTSAVLAGTSPFLFARNEEIYSNNDIILRFAVTSDIHYPGLHDGYPYPGNSMQTQQERFSRMLRVVNQYSAAQPYRQFDALAVVGDMTDRGIDQELVPFCETMDAFLSPETRRVLCMGSHEYFGGSRAYWEEICRMPGNSHQVINGYHFIALSPDDTNESDGVYMNRLDWVHEELKKAAADGKERPIFFFQHYHVSRPETEKNKTASPQWLRGRSTTRSHYVNWGASDLFELFESYPQIIDFSGHSHYPIMDPGVAWQGKFSAFGTGTLCYAKMLEEPYDTTPPRRFEYAQFYIVEVFRNNAVRLKIYDLAAGSFVPNEFFVRRPGDPDSYLYTDDRMETSPIPQWAEGTQILADQIESTGGTFHFAQTKNKTETQSYRVEIYRKDKPDTPMVTRYLWSEFYQYPMPEFITFQEDGLPSGTACTMKIYAVNFFNRENPTPLSFEFTTG